MSGFFRKNSSMIGSRVSQYKKLQQFAIKPGQIKDFGPNFAKNWIGFQHF